MKKFLNLGALALAGVLAFSGCDNEESKVETYTIQTISADTEKGKVYGSGTYINDSTITIAATANPGYVFEKWSDNDINPIRNIKVNDNTNYTAYFKKATQYYALDKVEFFVEEDGKILAKSVEYTTFKIYVNDAEEPSNVISDGASTRVNGIEIGQKLVDSINISGNVSTNIYVNEQHPINFYSARNENNIFAKNSIVDLTIRFGYMCHSGYISDGEIIFDNNFNNHGSSLTTDLEFEITEETIKTVTLIDDTQHGYKIKSKLHFVEI